jgi:23S rRNA (cytidine1920-2'-O)/16S rRNA (cytidine1409-2'-O)-methyltransferase
VVVLERENARTIDPARVPEPCDLAVIDVSFISLTLVLPRVRELLRPPAGKPIVALVKPQFEVGRALVGKGGVVRDPAARRGAVDKVRDWAAAHGFVAGGDVESPITGPAGNVEYLLLLRTAPDAQDAARGPAAARDTTCDAEAGATGDVEAGATGDAEAGGAGDAEAGATRGAEAGGAGDAEAGATEPAPR